MSARRVIESDRFCCGTRPSTLNDRRLEQLQLVVGLAKPVLFALTAVVLMVVWAFQGHFLIAGCMAGLLGLPVVGIIALNRETRTWARALIALAVIAGMGLAMWRFALAWL